MPIHQDIKGDREKEINKRGCFKSEVKHKKRRSNRLKEKVRAQQTAIEDNLYAPNSN